jgi:phosphohistidine phosphatase
MLLYLLRHAEAEPCRTDDFSRRLTEKGRDQARRVGEFLEARKIIPDLILSSPVLRAKETAEIVTNKLAGADLSMVPWLACGMFPETALHELAAYQQFESVMLVGHEPDFSSLIATLIGLESSATINVSKASLTAIDLTRFTPRSGVLRFFLPVKLI